MADNTGTIIAAAVRPAASEDSYASAFANEIKGGFHSVADETARDAITEDRRQEGMLCYVIADEKTYQLQGGIENTDWVEYSVDVSGLVPYEGASQDVDLGVNSLTATSVSVGTTTGLTPAIYGEGNIAIRGKGNSIFGTDAQFFGLTTQTFDVYGTYPMILPQTDGFFNGLGLWGGVLGIYDNDSTNLGTIIFIDNGVTNTARFEYDFSTDTFTISDPFAVGKKHLDVDGNLSAENLTIDTAHSLIPETDETYDLGTSLLQWKDLYLSGSVYIAGTELSTTSLEFLYGLDQNLTTESAVQFDSLELSGSITVDAATTGSQQFYQIAGSNIWSVSYLATVINFRNITLGDNVLQLQEDGDALLYRNLWVKTGKIGIGYDGKSPISAGLQMNHNDGILSMGTLGSGYAGFKDAVTAMQWNPNTASFRVGRCSNGTAWDTLGNYSLASGLDNVASGQSSTSMGQINQATGNFSVALGFDNDATAAYSYAIGNANTSQTNQNTYCFGQGNTSFGGPSMALGFSSTASGSNSMAIGNTATSSHNRSIVISAGTANASSDATNQLKLASQYVDLVPSTYARVGDLTNYSRISPTGDLTFIGSAGLYPRTLTQASAPAAGTGATQLDTGEMCIWIDSDDSKCYYCFNQAGTIKKVELT